MAEPPEAEPLGQPLLGVVLERHAMGSRRTWVIAPATEHPPRCPFDDREGEWVIGGTTDGGVHLIGHLQPEPLPLLLVPDHGVEDVQPSKRMDEQAAAHRACPSRARISARTSSHGMAASGFAFRSADRRANS